LFMFFFEMKRNEMKRTLRGCVESIVDRRVRSKNKNKKKGKKQTNSEGKQQQQNERKRVTWFR